MWLLTNINSGCVLLVISEKSKYTVGRVGADLLITGDTSVSRTHAFLHISVDSSEAGADDEILELEDAGSKFGTFHNAGIAKNAVIPKNIRLPLSNGDRIRFGLLQSTWSVSHCPPVSAMSALPAEQTQKLAQHLKVLGGKIQTSWDGNCTHLTMVEVSLTVKVLHALLDQKPIVTCDYWHDMVQTARRSRKTLPKVESYLPPCSEDIAQNQQLDLSSRVERKTIFAGLTFVFLSALHNKTYAPIVEKAGGRCKHLNVGIQRSFLVRKDVVVIQYIPSTESQSSQTICSIEDHLNSNSRRIVPEYEIGLAIIHCTIEKYCNPGYDMLADLMPMSVPTVTNADDSLVLATEPRPDSGSTTDCEQTEVFIPETDQKSVASTNISEKSTNTSTPTTSQRADLNGAVVNAVVDSPLVSEVYETYKPKRKRPSAAMKNVIDESDSDEELLNIPKKAAPISTDNDSNKRRRTRSSAASKNVANGPDSDEELLNFPKKTGTATPVSTEVFNKDTNRRKQTRSSTAAKNVVNGSDSDEELFNFPEKAVAESAISTENDTNTRKRTRASAASKDATNKADSDEELFNFPKKAAIDTPMSVEVQSNDTNKSKQTRSNAAPKKVINGSDSDGELFNFPEKPIAESAISTENDTSKRKQTRASAAPKNLINASNSDEELFNFPEKANENGRSTPKRVTRHQQNSMVETMKEQSPLSDKPSTSKNCKQRSRTTIQPLPNVAIERQPKSVIRTTGFLEKSHATVQKANVTINAGKSASAEDGNKRQRYAVLDNSDDDDLFCFGDESPPSKKNKAKRICLGNVNLDDDSDEELFAFGDKPKAPSAKQAVDECDKATEPSQRKSTTKDNNPPMPKPKLLPAKLNITSWLSINKLEIKTEEVKEEEQQQQDKKEKNEGSAEIDTNDAIIGGALVKTLSKISLLHAEDRNNSKPVVTATVLSTNGKRFMKKFNPQQRQVIRTLPITVRGYC